MKRIGNLYNSIISLPNLVLADQKARRGKKDQYGVKAHDRRRDQNILDLHQVLKEKRYKTSSYKTFEIRDPKERLVFCLPYYPDRIVHHAVMNLLEPIFTSVFTADSYSCIKNKGIHAAQRDLEHALRRDIAGTQYCLKLDIKKFYPSIDHDILKLLLRRKFKDPDLLWLLNEIIDSAEGVPIGNYLSQFFANFYLTYFDHWLKEVLKIKYYFRYADDLVILSDSKGSLHRLLSHIRHYLFINLKLQIKENYQVFPVADRGIDFIGYLFYHSHTLLRKSIKQRFARKVARGCSDQTIASYLGWALHCSSNHLLKKLLNNERFQSIKHKNPGTEFQGVENKDQQDPRQGDSGGGIQDRGIKIRGQR